MAPKLIKTQKPFCAFSAEADKDYLLARMTNFIGAAFNSRAGYFAQQACEKYMKALTVEREGGYLETHKLRELASLCETYDPYFSETNTKHILERFDMFGQVGRYGAAANYDPLSQGKAVGGNALTIGPDIELAGAFTWLPAYLDDLDGFVFKARSLLDFGKGSNDDGLKSILENNSRSYLLGTWTGPVPLRVVLTKGNRYFRAT
jgi:HEPN domain-containing protein